MYRTMLLLTSFLLNAGSNFALGLLLARELGPGPFGVYAIAVAGAGALAVPLVEWLRHAATRFTRLDVSAAAAQVRATLDACALAAVVGVILLILLARLLGDLLPVPAAALMPAGLMMLCGALVDLHCAILRAQSRVTLYAGLVVARSGLTLLVLTATARATGDPVPVLWAGTCAMALVLAAGRVLSREPEAQLRKAKPAVAREFARYGFPLVAAGAFALLQAFINRTAIAEHFGLAQAGAFSLAWDIAIRIVAVVGSATDILLFQRAVRADQALGRVAARRMVQRNARIVAGLLLLAGAAYAALLPLFEAHFVDNAFRGDFMAFSLALLPGLVLWALMQFALAPFLQIEGRTSATIPPLALALACNIAFAGLLREAWGPLGQAAAFSLGMLPGFLLSCAIVWRRALADQVPVPTAG